jgi:hypothetical protein
MGAWGHLPFDNDTTNDWDTAHKIKPPPALLKRVPTPIDRILGSDSELRELWEEGDEADAWRAAIDDLRGTRAGITSG